MNNKTIFKKLDSNIPDSEAKDLLLAYIKKQLERQKNDPQASEAIAYKIAGLLSTRFARSLAENDSYLRILQIAGNLELPDRHRDGTSWENLTNLTNALEKS